MKDIKQIVDEKAKELVERGKVAEKAPQPQTVEPSAPFEIDPNSSYEQRAKEIVGALATQEAIKDEELKRGITDRKKSALLNSADADMKREEAENKQADIKLQEANYGVHSGVASYAGIKKPLPSKMQAILFTILSVIQTIFLIGIGVPISIINITADGIDSVVKKLGTLTKSAMWIVLVIIIGGAVFLLWQIAQYFISRFGAI